MRVTPLFLSIVFLSTLLLLPEKVEAQRELVYGRRNGALPPIMGTFYPSRYRIRGLIELNYWDYKTKNTYAGNTIEGRRKVFEQRYRLGLDGYILHPRLAVFSTDVTLRDKKTEYKETTEKLRDIGYRLTLNILPLRPISLSVYAERDKGTSKAGTSSPYEATSNNYGARLLVTYNSKLPKLRAEYNHWDYRTEREAGKRDIDRYSLNLTGPLSFMRSRYVLGYEYTSFSSPLQGYTGQMIKGDIYTAIGKGKSLTTSLQYSDIDISKLLTFLSQLEINLGERLEHGYSYMYQSSEAGMTKTESQEIQGRWAYKFSDTLLGRAGAGYSMSKSGNTTYNSLNINAGLTYSRPIKDFYFRSYYNISYLNQEKMGNQQLVNNLGVGLETRRLKFGRVYTDYDLNYTTTDQGDSIQHVIRLGIDGRGPKRASWSVVAEFTDFSSDIGGQGVVYTGGPLGISTPGARSGQYYSLTATVNYPIGRRGMAVARGNYTVGDIDSTRVKNYYYEARFNYSLLRNLSVVSWWREGWDEIEGANFRRKARNFELRLSYRLRMVFVSLEYRIWRIDEINNTSDERSLYVTLRRVI